MCNVWQAVIRGCRKYTAKYSYTQMSTEKGQVQQWLHSDYVLKGHLGLPWENYQHAVIDECLCIVAGCALGTNVCHWMLKKRSTCFTVNKMALYNDVRETVFCDLTRDRSIYHYGRFSFHYSYTVTAHEVMGTGNVGCYILSGIHSISKMYTDRNTMFFNL